MRPLRHLIVLAIVAFAVGCSGKNAPDVSMTNSPTGLWIGKADSGTSIDIQSGGAFKMTRAGRESNGTWNEPAAGQLKVLMGGQTYDLTYVRRDLGIKLTLPGDAQPTEFEQM